MIDLLTISVAKRLALAACVSAALWLAVAWALG
jgi:hypothetical protein